MEDEMEKNWVDFKQVKSAVSMEMVLAHYGLNLRRVNATYLRGRCPLPAHSSEASKESFGVQTTTNAWACQSKTCVAARGGRKGGNILDFVAAMEDCSIRDAALKLQAWFLAGQGSGQDQQSASPGAPARVLIARKDKRVAESDNGKASNEGCNTPLEFSLRGIDSAHPYLTQRGITKATAEAFGVGFFSGKGSMSNRIVFPICNAAGELVAYAGRSLDSSEPEYKFPPGFKKTLELYNLHRAIATGSKRVVVVEGFFDTMNTYQAGFPCTVGLLGASLSDAQAALLQKYFDKAVVMLDGNDAGRIGAAECAAKLAQVIIVRFVWLPPGKEPDILTADELRSLLTDL
jgi:DNA primase